MQKQLPGRRQTGQGWVDQFTSALVDKLGVHEVRERSAVFLDPAKQVDDVHGSGQDPQVEKFKEDLAAHNWFRDDGVHREGAE